MNISADHYLLSFIGFAPYDHPEVVCYVLMDNPSEDSSSVTGSLFAAIMNEVLPYLNVAKDGTVTDTTAEQPQEGQTTDPAAEQPQEGQTTDPAAEQPQEPETTVSNIGMEEHAQTNIEGQTSASGE